MVFLPAMFAFLIAQVPAPPTFFDTPANHWFYEGYRAAKRDGLASDFDDGFLMNSVVSPSQLAKDLRHTMVAYRDLGLTLLKEREKIVATTRVDSDTAEAYTQDFKLYSGMRHHIAWFQKGVVEFKVELAAMGEVPSVAELTRIANRVQSFGPAAPGGHFRLFRDVPPDHWAAKAVGDLRALGLLDGYPDGTFRG